MNDGALEEGSFVVDMTSIAVRDAELPDEYKAKLKGHLENEDFFDVLKFATTTVSLGEYADGNLEITLNVMGKEVKYTVPVAIAETEDGATIDGSFSIDFSEVGLLGLKPEPGGGDSISPIIEFGIRAVLTK